jgi:hypothetical protein
MKIYIDESGTFTQSRKKPSLSVVGSLAIPDVSYNRVLKKYGKLRSKLPKSKGEVKGKLLSEQQVSDVIEILRRNEVLFEATLIDLRNTNEAVIETYRVRQCENLTAKITEAHHSNTREWAWALRRRLERMSMPLYVQSELNFQLIWKTLEHFTAYFSQRRPECLAEIEWFVDAKQPVGSTDWENWWRAVMFPLFQTRSMFEPFAMIEDGDYSRLPSEERVLPEYLADEFPTHAGEAHINLSPSLANIRFVAAPDPGLELVDIVTNALRRALVGNLQPSGWSDLPALMIHRPYQYVDIMRFGSEDPELTQHCRGVLHRFKQGGKSMLAPRLDR